MKAAEGRRSMRGTVGRPEGRRSLDSLCSLGMTALPTPLHGPRLPERRDPQPVLVQALRPPPSTRAPRRLVHRLVGEAERAPVEGEHQRRWCARVRSEEILVDLRRLLGIDMDAPHEPARIVGTDRDHHEIERPASRADLAERGMVRCVAGEVGTGAGALERVAAPPRLVLVAYT